MFLPVLTKQDFARRFRCGEFGNRGPMWDTLEEFAVSGYRGLVHLRNRKKVAGNTYYDLKPASAFKLWQRMVDPDEFFIAAMAPTEKTLFQGEVQLSERGLDLFYTRIALPMRQALVAEAMHAHGIIAVHLLRYFLCPNSYDWLQVLLDRYQDHVIEFSTYSVNWGTLPNHNTIVWEIRKY